MCKCKKSTNKKKQKQAKTKIWERIPAEKGALEIEKRRQKDKSQE